MFATIFSKWHHLTEISRDLWKWYSYRDYGIIAEPYFDLDFSRVLYLTDTGRSEEHTSELQSRGHLVCRLLLEKKNKKENTIAMTKWTIRILPSDASERNSNIMYLLDLAPSEYCSAISHGYTTRAVEYT